jgi:hypothetical protein
MWTYSGDPISSAKDEVRFLTGDTDVTKPWTLQDAEINYAVTLYSAAPPVIGQNFYAAWTCAKSILAKLKGVVASKSVGDLHIAYVNQLTLMQETVKSLANSANLQAVPVYLGGTSKAEKRAQNADADRVQPAFQVDGMDKVSTVNDSTQGP